MSLRIIKSAITAEQTDDAHLARLLLLLYQRSDKKCDAVNGITKLAKMDFLLRYPKYLQRVVDNKFKRPFEVVRQSYEEDTVESRMIRFRYGPWDHRYRRWIGLLLAKGMVATYVEGRTVYVKLTNKGKLIAKRFSESDDFKDLSLRSSQVERAVGAMSGTALKDKIYEVVPELSGMVWGQEIDI